MPNKPSKLTLLEREIRATKKQQLSSEGRTQGRLRQYLHHQTLNRSARWKAFPTYQAARDYVLSLPIFTSAHIPTKVR